MPAPTSASPATTMHAADLKAARSSLCRRPPLEPHLFRPAGETGIHELLSPEVAFSMVLGDGRHDLMSFAPSRR